MKQDIIKPEDWVLIQYTEEDKTGRIICAFSDLSKARAMKKYCQMDKENARYLYRIMQYADYVKFDCMEHAMF